MQHPSSYRNTHHGPMETQATVSDADTAFALASSRGWTSQLQWGSWDNSTLTCYSLPSGPPSAPVNLISSVNGTSVTLEWAPPLDPGGRNDITYNAVCRRCPWALSHCEACGSGTRFVPQQTSLAQASLLVANLLAHTNYSFWIEAVNGVSNLSPEPRSAAVVNITTNQAGTRSSPEDPHFPTPHPETMFLLALPFHQDLSRDLFDCGKTELTL